MPEASLEDRAKALEGNLFTVPVTRADLTQQMMGTGVDVTSIPTTSVSALELEPNQSIDAVIALAPVQLQWVIEALGPRGIDVLTPEGIEMIKNVSSAPADHEPERAKLEDGFNAFEQISAIVDTRDPLNDGTYQKFDLIEGNDAELELTFGAYVHDWVNSGLGKPSLLELSGNNQLDALKDSVQGMHDAYELSHPGHSEHDNSGFLGFSISTSFEKGMVGRTPGDHTWNVIIRGPEAPTPGMGR